MEVVGWVALVLLALVIAFVLFMGVRSIPDIRRYRRIRNMYWRRCRITLAVTPAS